MALSNFVLKVVRNLRKCLAKCGQVVVAALRVLELEAKHQHLQAVLVSQVFLFVAQVLATARSAV